MPVYINQPKFFNIFDTVNPVDFALFNVGDKVIIEIPFDVKTYVVASQENTITLNAYNGFAEKNWIVDPSFGFVDFRIGDTILFNDKSDGTGEDQTFTIIDKRDDGAIRLNGSIKQPSSSDPLDDDFPSDDCIISVSTPIEAVKYRYNFIENNEPPSFKSKIDGSTQELHIKSIAADDPTLKDMFFIGEKSYQTGFAVIQGTGIQDEGVYVSSFKIIHHTKVTPFLLSEQIADLIAGKNAPYFVDSKCLKAIFDINAAVMYNNPNWVQTQQITEVLGNSGGYNENFNTGITNYTISGLTYKDSNGDLLDTIQLSEDEGSVEFLINNTEDAPFADDLTEFELQFLKAPFDKSEYQLNGRTVDQNFIDDRAFTRVGDPAIDGEAFGIPTRQVLKDVEAEFISTSQIKVKAKIKFLPGTLGVMVESETPRYMLNIAIQNHTLNTELADLVRLKVDLANGFINTSSPGLCKAYTIAYKHTESGAVGEGSRTPVTAPEDEMVPYSQIYIDKTNYLNDVISIISINATVKAYNPVEEKTVILRSFPLSFSGLPRVNGNQNINFVFDEVYNVPDGEIRKKIKVRRRTNLDFDNRIYYDFIYPVWMRWEYWVSLLQSTLTPDADVFFDPSLPNNGLNQDWFAKTNLSDWDIYYEIKPIVSRNGVAEAYPDVIKLDMFDRYSNPNWSPKTIKSFDGAGTELFDPITNTRYLKSDEQTVIKAEFTSTTGTPDLEKIVVNMHIEAFEVGGIEGSRRMSSKWPSDANTWFKSIDASNRAVLTLVGDTVVATLKVDNNKIPSDVDKFSISARLYESLCQCPEGTTTNPDTGGCIKEVSTEGPPQGKSGYHWRFGHFAWLDHNERDGNNYPVYRLGSPLTTEEGCTTISKSDTGELLITSDGTKVWDGQDIEVANDLRGAPGSVHSAIIIQDNSDEEKFDIACMRSTELAPNYGFTTNIATGVTTAGLTLTPGNKNIQIYPDVVGAIKTAEKIAAISDGNGGTWIIIKEYKSAGLPLPNWLVFKRNSSGTIDTTPSTTFPSTMFNGSTGPLLGQVKFNQQGTKFVSAGFSATANNDGVSTIEMFDFDKSTGQLSNPIVLSVRALTYGVEFSPSGRFLYISTTRESGFSPSDPRGLYQFDISSDDQATIQSTKIMISGDEPPTEGFSLQLGPDGYIYRSFSRYYQNNTMPNYIGVIRNPDLPGLACDYREDVPLNGDPLGYYPVTPGQIGAVAGLPTFVSSIFNKVEEVEFPCDCICPDGWQYDSVNKVCKKTSVEENPEAFKWHVPNGQAADFGDLDIDGDPTPYAGSAMSSPIACADICDEDGNTMLYTDGVNAYKPDNTPYPVIFAGSKSACQGVTPTKTLDSGNRYLIAHIPDLTQDLPPRYSIFNLDTLSFDVTNALMVDAATRVGEKFVVCTISADKKMFLMRKRDGSQFIKVPFTSSGVGAATYQAAPAFGSSNLIMDASGNNNNGVLGGTILPTLITSPVATGKALRFQGGSGFTSYAQFGNIMPLTSTGFFKEFDLTIEDNTINGFIEYRGIVGSFSYHILYLQSDGIKFTFGGGANFSTGPLANGTYRIGISIDVANQKASIYVDCIRMAHYASASIIAYEEAYPFYFGPMDTNVHIKGSIDNYREFNYVKVDPTDLSYVLEIAPYVLTDEEVYYKFDELSNLSNKGVLKTNNSGFIVETCYKDKTYLYPFDGSTMTLGTPVLIEDIGVNNFSAEFSGNGKVLYIGTRDFSNPSAVNQINQYDLMATDIPGSSFNVYTNTDQLGLAQIGTNKIIYWTAKGGTSLMKIAQPNTIDAGCNFSFDGPAFDIGSLTDGLPNYERNIVLITEYLPCPGGSDGCGCSGGIETGYIEPGL